MKSICHGLFYRSRQKVIVSSLRSDSPVFCSGKDEEPDHLAQALSIRCRGTHDPLSRGEAAGGFGKFDDQA